MPALNDAFSESATFALAAAAAALFIAAALGLTIIRLRWRRRIRGPGHPSRLAVVEGFDLDPRRRLLIVQRDSVEHLIMIGRSSDLAIEADIVSDRDDETDRAYPEEALGADFEKEETAQQAGTFAPAVTTARRRRRLPGLPAARTARALAKTLSIGSGLIPLALLSGAAGAGAGLVCGLFRLSLREAAHFRASMPDWWREEPYLGLALMVVGAATATALAVWLVRRFIEQAAGSGIPHIEAVIAGKLPPPSLILLPVKFIGGVLAIGAGLALGREGPSVQMGATLSHALGKAFGRNSADCRSLLAAGAGAGLAAAFNAPLSGSAFVLEELIRQFDVRDSVAALGAAGSAIVMAQLLTGPEPALAVGPLPFPDPIDNLLCFALGGAVGVAGVVYSRVLLGALALADRLGRWPAELRGAALGAAVGVLAWYEPDLAGDGEALIQQTLNAAYGLGALPFLYLLRLALGSASYASGAPGGIFAPLLVLGAQMGFFFGGLWHPATIDPTAHAISFALVAMAAFFTAVVRAPLTGIILVTEMTNSSTLLLPMLAACFSAMAVATMLAEPPIYDSLKERILAPLRQRSD